MYATCLTYILPGILGTVNVAAITDFIDGGGNLMVAASPDVSELIRELAAEVGGMKDNVIVIISIHGLQTLVVRRVL